MTLLTPERVLSVSVWVQGAAAAVSAVSVVIDMATGRWGEVRWPLVWIGMNAIVVYVLLALERLRCALGAQHDELLRDLTAKAEMAEVLLARLREGHIVAEIGLAPTSDVKH